MAASIKNLINVIGENVAARVTALKKLLDTIRADLVAVRAPLAGLLTGSAVYDPANLADGAGATTTITVTGAALGDFVVGVSFSLDLQGVLLVPYVSAADTVSVRFQNESGGAVDLASGTLRAVVAPRASFVAPAALTLSA
jgi:hypothetical protein